MPAKRKCCKVAEHALHIYRVRPNGKLDIHGAEDGAWVTLDANLGHLAGRYLSEAELLAVIDQL